MARPVVMAAMALLTFLGFLFLLFPSSFSQSSEPIGKASDPIVSAQQDGDYLVGVGKADITGPVVEINLMGYADTAQTGTGLRQRLYTRAFIFANSESPSERVAYLVLDTQSGDTAIRHGILEGLKGMGPEYDVYSRSNVAVTGTHSHSGPGAWLNYLLPQITSNGFSKESYQAIVDGSLLAIRRAHESLTTGTLRYGSAKVVDGNANRSPAAYLENPASERAQYTDDVDKDLTLLEVSSAGRTLGLLSWFPVHGTSLYQNNTLITGDNKGVAAYLMEEAMKSTNPSFVAGFSQANVGDTTPNTLGAYCEETGLQCTFNDSTCDGKTQGCHGRGPFFQYNDQGTKSCFDIGRRQYEAARSLLDSADLQPITGPTVSSYHFFQDMSNFTFSNPLDQSREAKTCSAALGYSFAGGTTDGPGAFDFTQGLNDTDDSPALDNPVWKAARFFLHQPSDAQMKCQSPKPILLDVGATTKPYQWSPNIVDIQMLRVGSLFMIIAPGEATTMSGRRWRKAIAEGASGLLDVEDPKVVIGGPANTYAHYIATEEEYGFQRYEGASTLYGPHTLAAYVNLTVQHLPYLGNAAEVTQLPALALGPSPPINVNNSLSFITGVVVDNPQILKKFGDALESPDSAQIFTAGEIVAAKFVGANPRNNFRLEGTFAAVEQRDEATGQWSEVRTDKDWFLVYNWKRTSTILGTSEVTLEWEIEPGTPKGVYRLRYYGDWKSLGGKITAFEGTSGTFNVDGGGSGGSIVDELLRM
ncbi:Neutral ceramidase [Cyphellophora attinorum]|uniref:Neutral ceramidase n=1 Tax=Cyphellophora attinorum TaxID=1664694 RepID=A0A0N1HPF1_9EURO|nr:Neutral ceramidase [Phialophora attinorum]KPI37116.1 Neutral ceramidase [Phialophora attinorum]